MENRFVSMYQRQSAILTPSSPGIMGEIVVRGDLDNLRSHQLRIRGEADGDFVKC